MSEICQPHVHYGGKFVHQPKNKYKGGKVEIDISRQKCQLVKFKQQTAT